MWVSQKNPITSRLSCGKRDLLLSFFYFCFCFFYFFLFRAEQFSMKKKCLRLIHYQLDFTMKTAT